MSFLATFVLFSAVSISAAAAWGMLIAWAHGPQEDG